MSTTTTSNRWLALYVLCTGVLMIVLDATVVIEGRSDRQVIDAVTVEIPQRRCRVAEELAGVEYAGEAALGAAYLLVRTDLPRRLGVRDRRGNRQGGDGGGRELNPYRAQAASDDQGPPPSARDSASPAAPSRSSTA